MKRKILLAAVLLVFMVGCSSLFTSATNQSSQSNMIGTITQGVKGEKDIAEGILFNARVLLNTKIITQDQYSLIRDAYEKLRKTQDSMIAGYLLLMQSPTPNNQGAYQLNVTQLINDIQSLTSLAQNFGIIKEGGTK